MIESRKKCWHFNNGFCKFKVSCRYEHPKEICQTYQCKNQSCEKRHPKACRLFRSHHQCKFGDKCAYSHDIVKDYSQNKDTDNTSEIKEINRNLEESNKTLKEQLQKLTMELTHAKDDIIKKEVLIKSHVTMLEEKEASIKDCKRVIQNKEKKVTEMQHEIEIKNKEIQDLKRNETLAKPKFECDQCDEEFPSIRYLRLHIVENHGDDSKTLIINRLRGICQKDRESIKVFLDELEEENMLNNIADFIPKMWKDMKTDSENYMWSERKFRCDECDAACINKKCLNIHKKSVHKIKCEKCSYVTTTNNLLRFHELRDH